MADVRRRSDPDLTPLPTALPPPPGPPPVPVPDDELGFDEPTQPAYLAIAARGTEQRARLARASRPTQPLPLPRPPAGQKREP